MFDSFHKKKESILNLQNNLIGQIATKSNHA
jgi:hypothetical protein